MRRFVLYGFLLAAVLAVLLFRGPIEAGVERAVARHSARRTLASWGLEPSRDNVALYLAADHARLGAWIFDDGPIGIDGPLPATPDDIRFSENWTYGDLFARGWVTIGIFNADRAVAARLDRLVGDYPAGPGRGIAIRRLRSREDLLRSLANDTATFYFGHANLGQGIRFDPQNLEKPLPMDDGTLADLVVHCKVFGYFGCRTDRYFRDVWKRHFPQVDFIATTYVCHTTVLAPEILKQWVEGLQRGRNLGQIVAALNRNKADILLFGRMEEVGKYRNAAGHADQLFTY